jgi:nitrogen fixation NifU-like protein
MDDLSDLYQDIILTHYKHPHNEGELDPHTGEAEGFNPLCGDRLKVYLRQADGGKGALEAVTFSGEGCAISKASASIMTSAVKGLAIGDVEKKVAEVMDLLTDPDEPDIDLMTMGDLAALAGVRKFPARIKCATLAWHALLAALKDEASVSTEAEEG